MASYSPVTREFRVRFLEGASFWFIIIPVFFLREYFGLCNPEFIYEPATLKSGAVFECLLKAKPSGYYLTNIYVCYSH